eukprot:scpid32248/ scgid28019/ 
MSIQFVHGAVCLVELCLQASDLHPGGVCSWRGKGIQDILEQQWSRAGRWPSATTASARGSYWHPVLTDLIRKKQCAIITTIMASAKMIRHYTSNIENRHNVYISVCSRAVFTCCRPLLNC